MRKVVRAGLPMILVFALAAPLGGCGPAPKKEQDQTVTETENTVPASEGNAPAAAGSIGAPPGAPAAFGICATCHTVEKGTNGVGPSLFGVVGRKAGSLPDFDYSDAMKNSNVTWDEANLDKYITNPQAMIPGNKMPFAGLPDAAKRKDVISYLETLK